MGTLGVACAARASTLLVALGALQKAGLLAEPTPEMRQVAEAYDTRHSPAARKRLLAELRRLRLSPSLSETILQNRE